MGSDKTKTITEVIGNFTKGKFKENATLEPEISEVVAISGKLPLNKDEEIIVNALKYTLSEWKKFPSLKKMVNKMNYIENNINLRNKKELVGELAEIEIASWELCQYFSSIKNEASWTETEKLQQLLIIEKLNEWISEYHDKLFNGL